MTAKLTKGGVHCRFHLVVLVRSHVGLMFLGNLINLCFLVCKPKI